MSVNVETSPAQNRRRKAKALAAAGTVLGIGAVVTLAAWNDSEFAEGIFGTGSYNVESSEDGSSFQDHEGGDAGVATLDFQAENVVPGGEYAAGFWLRTDAGTSFDGVVTDIEVSASSGDVASFTGVRVLNIPAGETCTPGTAGTVVASGATLGALSFDTSSEITLENNDSAPGEIQQLCFQVTADEDGIEQGDAASVTWAVHTESVDG